jgi:CheY-like chemotaxis protein
MARILVADDEADLRELLRTVLAFDDHDITVADDGVEALEQLAAGSFDLLLLDVMMPRRDGWWVLDQVKGSDEWSEMPVVMLTARAADLDRIEGAIGGAVRYVTKPFSVADLRATIVDVLAGPPEPEQRKQSQRQGLIDLAKLDPGRPREVSGVSPARPRLTRLDGPERIERPKRPDRRVRSLPRHALSDRQRALLEAVVRAPTIMAAAESLNVSRSYLYASLGRIAGKAGMASGPEMVRRLRSGELTVGGG